MFPQERRWAAVMPAYGAFVLHLSYLDGKVIETTPALSCLSIWNPPGHATSRLSWVRSAPRLLRLLARTSPADVRRFATFVNRLEKRRHELLPQPHWSLEALAVRPERQGFGLGAVLARHGLARADQSGTPTYVQTDGQDNADFYRKLGFELAEYVEDYPSMTLPTWRMIRRPRPTSDSAQHQAAPPSLPDQ